jgi:hypothetical protein
MRKLYALKWLSTTQRRGERVSHCLEALNRELDRMIKEAFPLREAQIHELSEPNRFGESHSVKLLRDVNSKNFVRLLDAVTADLQAFDAACRRSPAERRRAHYERTVAEARARNKRKKGTLEGTRHAQSDRTTQGEALQQGTQARR